MAKLVFTIQDVIVDSEDFESVDIRLTGDAPKKGDVLTMAQKVAREISGLLTSFADSLPGSTVEHSDDPSDPTEMV